MPHRPVVSGRDDLYPDTPNLLAALHPLALEREPPAAFLGPLRSIQAEVLDAQDCVRSIAGVEP